MTPRLRTALVAAILSFGLVAHAQMAPASERPTDRLEALNARSGKVSVREFLETKTVYGFSATRIELTPIYAYDPSNAGDGFRGIRVRVVAGPKEYDRSAAIVDRNEVGQILAGLDYLIDLGKRWEAEMEPYREADLTTEDGLKIGFYHTEEGKQAVYVSHSDNTAFFALEDLAVLKELFAVLAKTLDEHRPTAAEGP